MECKTDRSKMYYGSYKWEAREVDKRVVQQGNEVFASIRMVFQFASFPIQSPLFILDPYQAAPLSAIAGVKTALPTQITVTVAGKNGADGDISHTFPGYSTVHLIPVLGLYPGHDNQVTLQVTDEQGAVQSTTLTATTGPLDEAFGQIDIITPAQKDKLSGELYITSLQNSYAAATDKDGEVRWMIREHYDENLPTNIFGHDPFYKLNNGRLLFRHVSQWAIGEVDFVGRIHRLIDTDFTVHHDVVQMPDGNLLVQSEDPDRATQEDMLSIMDYETGEILHNIDFTKIFDPAIPPQPDMPPRDGFESDWWHENSVDYDLVNNVYITSARHQNVVAATDIDTNVIRWMLGSPTRWPERFQQYFLIPVDAEGHPLYDFNNTDDVAAADRDFYNWAQHSAKIVSQNGNITDLILFNNGAYRSYDSKRWIVPYENWSTAQYFRIDPDAMTVQLVWDFGRDLGPEYYSGYVGNVQYIEETNSMYVNFGGTNEDLDTGRNVGQPGDVPMDGFPPENYETARIQEKVRIIESSLDNGEILFAFDRYMPGILGVYQSYQYKGMKTSLYSNVDLG